MKLSLEKSFSTTMPQSENVSAIAAMFGLGIDSSKTIKIVPPVELSFNSNEIMFITGPSGSGKSTLLNLIRLAIQKRHDVQLIDFNRLPSLENQPLVDCLQSVDPSLNLQQILKLLSTVGLNDAFVMLRTPAQLSDGQQYRFQLAVTLAMADQNRPGKLTVILADEFGATLDRVTASVLAMNIRKWVSRAGHRNISLCFVAATTHDDLLESLEPDILVEQQLGGTIQVVAHEDRK